MILCALCGEEVRRGWRHGREAWWHREDVDHNPILGQRHTAAMEADLQLQLDLPRTRLAKGVSAKCPTYQRLWPLEVYTTREHDLERYRKKKSFREAEEVAEDEIIAELPPVEIPCHPIQPADLAPRSGIRQVVNLLAKHGWELVRLTHSRGPYVGSRGECLSISDSIVLAGRSPMVDDSRSYVVASWRDGKYDFAIAIESPDSLEGKVSRKMTATELKNMIKGTNGPHPSNGAD